MALLISKVQNRNCEKGEFHEVAERNLEDTISLLLNFPWEQERHLANVELTCPSVTVEHPGGTFLKVGPYFSGKFSLYYLAGNKHVYSKPASTLAEAAECISSFFRQEGILNDFSKYGFVFRPSAHFLTNPFVYKLGGPSTEHFFKNARLVLLIGLFFAGLMFFMPMTVSSFTFLVILLVLTVLSYSPLIYLYFNYKHFDKDKCLQLSRGSDSFTLQQGDDTTVYQKSHIELITITGRRSRRNPWANCRVFNVSFKNGDEVQFTSLLIPEVHFRNKFPDHTVENVWKFLPAV